MKKLSLALALVLSFAPFTFAKKEKGGSENNGCYASCENGELFIRDKKGDVVLECKKNDFDNKAQREQFKKTVESCGDGKYIKPNKKHKHHPKK